MRIDNNSLKPIYLQIADFIADDILSGKLAEGEQAYSQLVLSRELGVNPATAAKGISVLVQRGILEKQRGLSMTVAHGARERLTREKTENELARHASELITEARKIEMPLNKLVELITELYGGEGGENDV